MKKTIILFLILIIFIASCSSEETPKTSDKSEVSTNDSTGSNDNTPTGTATVNLSPITINCENLINKKTITDLTPTKLVNKVEGKKEVQVVNGPSEFSNSRFESKTLTFDHKTISEQSCKFSPSSEKIILGGNLLNFRFVCGPKDQVSQKFNEEKNSARLVKEGLTEVSSFWGIKKEPIYSLLSGKVDCFVDIEGVIESKLGETIALELESKLG